MIKKSDTYFKPRTSLLRGHKRLLALGTILMLIALLGALYGFKMHFKDRQEYGEVVKYQDTGEKLTIGTAMSPNLGEKPPNVPEVLSRINEVRLAAGMKPVSQNGLLDQSALAKSEDMISRNYWSHNTPDGVEPWDFIKKAGYKYQNAGENLWYGHSNTVVNDWMNSPTHKTVMLDGNYTEIGISVQKAQNYNGEQNVYLVVTHYGSPLKKSAGVTKPPSGTTTDKSPVTTSRGSSYQLPAYSSSPLPTFDRPSPSFTSPTNQCVTNVDSSYSC